MLWQFLRREFGRPAAPADTLPGDAPHQAPPADAPGGGVQSAPHPGTVAHVAARADFDAGLAHHHAGRLAEAEVCYQRAISQDPDDARALYHLALILCAGRRLTEGARLASRAHALQPDNADYLECGRFAHTNAGLDATPESVQAEAAKTADAAALTALGNHHRQSGRFDDAEAAYRSALTAEPDNAFVHSRLGNLLASIGRYAEAQPCFDASARAGLKPDTLVRLAPGFLAALDARADRLAAPVPQGDWGRTEKSVVVFMSCDQRYFDRFAYALINSLAQNGGIDCLVHIHVVNPEANLDGRIETMRATPGFPDIAYSYETIDLAERGNLHIASRDVQTAGRNPHNAGGNVKSASVDAKTYYACARFLHLPALQRRYGKPVLVLDMDLLVIGRLDAWLAALGACDVGLIEYDRGRNDACEHFWASVLYCGATPAAAAFFDDVARYIAHFLDAGEPVWFLDQVALFAAYARTRSPAPRFSLLPGNLCQTSTTPDAGRLRSGADEPALFWSVTYSIAENAAKLDTPEFQRYAEPRPAVADFNRVKPCRHGTLMYNINDQYIGRALDRYAEFSQGEVDVFARIVRPGHTVVDAGANIGAHTVWFCRAVGAAGRVHAFEPQRVIFQTLCANIALNSFQNAHAHHAALGEHAPAGEPARTIKVDVPDYSRENNFGGMPLGGWNAGEDVALTSIDGLDLAACDFMKIDVEGMEQAVIRGAHDTIARHRPVLYVENDRPEHADALIRQLDALGYALYWHLPPYFNPDNFARNPDNIFGNIASRNMLCLPREKQFAEVDKWVADFGLTPVQIPRT